MANTYHEQEVVSSFFNDIVLDRKTFLVTFSKSNIQENDILKLCEFNTTTEEHTGRFVIAVVLSVTDNIECLSDEYVILSIDVVAKQLFQKERS